MINMAQLTASLGEISQALRAGVMMMEAHRLEARATAMLNYRGDAEREEAKPERDAADNHAARALALIGE